MLKKMPNTVQQSYIVNLPQAVHYLQIITLLQNRILIKSSVTSFSCCYSVASPTC